MKFALFYEIPVAKPWDEESEHRAYKDTLEQAILGDAMGSCCASSTRTRWSTRP